MSGWVEPFYMVSKPSSWGLLVGSAAWFNLLWTYIQGTVRWECILFNSFQTFLKGNVSPGVHTFDKVKNQLQGSKSGVQSVYLGFWTYL